MEVKDIEGFEGFLSRRNSIIGDYTEGDMSKKEFLENNYNFLKELNIKPFKKIDSFEKGMYNYQYYNVMAKYYNMKTLEEGLDKRAFNTCRDLKSSYYYEKDKATLDLLDFLDYEGLEAYFIDMESDFLNDQIFEIVLLNYEKAILHSKSNWILKKLRDREVFSREKRKSVIDDYINEKY